MGPNSSVRKHTLLLVAMGITSFIFTDTNCRAADLPIDQAINLMTASANSICQSVPFTHSEQGIVLTADAKIEVDGIIKKLANVDGGAAAKYKQSKEKRAVLESDLAKAVADGNNCRLDVFHSLERDLLSNTHVNAAEVGRQGSNGNAAQSPQDIQNSKLPPSSSKPKATTASSPRKKTASNERGNNSMNLAGPSNTPRSTVGSSSKEVAIQKLLATQEIQTLAAKISDEYGIRLGASLNEIRNIGAIQEDISWDADPVRTAGSLAKTYVDQSALKTNGYMWLDFTSKAPSGRLYGFDLQVNPTLSAEACQSMANYFVSLLTSSGFVGKLASEKDIRDEAGKLPITADVIDALREIQQKSSAEADHPSGLQGYDLRHSLEGRYDLASAGNPNSWPALVYAVYAKHDKIGSVSVLMPKSDEVSACNIHFDVNLLRNVAR